MLKITIFGVLPCMSIVNIFSYCFKAETQSSLTVQGGCRYLLKYM